MTGDKRREALEALVDEHGIASDCEVLEPPIYRWALKEAGTMVGGDGLPYWYTAEDWRTLLDNSARQEYPGDWLAERLYDLDTGWSTAVELRYEPADPVPEVDPREELASHYTEPDPEWNEAEAQRGIRLSTLRRLDPDRATVLPRMRTQYPSIQNGGVMTETDRTQTVLRVAALLNAGKKPTEALEECDIDPETVSSENSEAFALDDPDNGIIDFGWEAGELIVIHCVARDRATGSGTCWEVRRTEVVKPPAAESDLFTDCPQCNASDSIEAQLRVDVDYVAIDRRTAEVIDFDVAGSADNPGNGFVCGGDPAVSVSCRACGYELDADIPVALSERWTYRKDN